ncbi:hypothetical protein HW555_005639 [Spodoptera exigua]|uniref:Uncharacterized protein n=1 Tax=Spodoptera exigua TaxID=7107 RepID=A0A835GI43_SPOEX|nr:hypothetical protein HW555_005639 [Spodoptera exigua]
MDNRNLPQEKQILYLDESYINSSYKQNVAAEQAFSNITAEDWKNLCKHFMKIEKEYYDRGAIMYEQMERLNVQRTALRIEIMFSKITRIKNCRVATVAILVTSFIPHSFLPSCNSI